MPSNWPRVDYELDNGDPNARPGETFPVGTVARARWRQRGTFHGHASPCHRC